MFNLFDLFRRGKPEAEVPPEKDAIHRKYGFFRDLLTENNRCLEIITDLEQTFYADRAFSLGYFLVESEILIGETFNIAEDLNALSGGRYPGLFDTAEEIGNSILGILERRKRVEKSAFVIPLERLSREDVADVGGKAANLGEVFNRAGLPVPLGFAVTAYACQQFMDYNKLPELAEGKLRHLDVNDTEKLTQICEEIRAAVLQSELPPELENCLRQAYAGLKRRLGEEMRLAVRSSATSEDSEASFAGQHSTVLNVTEGELIPAYKEVVASTFNPRAVFYRRKKGYLDQDVVMSIACIEMINSKASGVMYTVDPNDSRHSVIMISAVWGLGVGAVDGSIPADFYQISKKTGHIEILEVAKKDVQFCSDPESGLKELPVPDYLADKPCLDENQIRLLVDYGLKLEEHYGMAQDIEWAMDAEGRIFILQSRPLKRPFKPGQNVEAPAAETESARQKYSVILRGGATASEGVASGPAYVLTSDHNLPSVPVGAILIAKQTSPLYVPVIGKVQAIITDVGSVTGHMASVAREFHIPTLVGTGSATQIIHHGEEITVDARNKVIYRGRVEGLLKDKKPINPMKGSPTYKAVQAALKKIAPLNLIDPKQDNFKPEGCQTIHDIIRFAHEMAMSEMFKISEELEDGKHIASRLRTSVPLNILVIDLGGGVAVDSTPQEITEEQINSVPFRALLSGMHHKDVQWHGPIGLDWRGFASILAESVFRDPQREEGMGGPSYAFISNDYLNFSSRLGYHFSTVDTYCGPAINDNYITFYFKGGAADIARRSRRAKLIGLILKKMGFKVEQKGDMITGSIKKYDSERLQEKLDMIGRLFGSVRLLDMMLSDDRNLDWYVDEFLKGNYTFRAHPLQE